MAVKKDKAKTIRGQLLMDVIKLVDNDRNKTHGDPVDQHRVAADFFNNYINRHLVGKDGEVDLQPSDICQLLILLKVSRRLCGDPKHADTYLDQAGYAALTHECVIRETQE